MTFIPYTRRADAGVFYSDTWTDLLVKDELLPPPIYLSPRKRVFIESELDAVAVARVAGKSKEEIRDLVRGLVAKRHEVAA